MLEGWLNWHRETLLAKCTGLEPTQLARTTVEPSNLTLLGLVRHMAEVERWWFRRSFAGEAIGDVFTSPSDGNEGLDGVHAADAERDFGMFQTEVKACDGAAAGHDLDETFMSARGDGMSVGPGEPAVRWLDAQGGRQIQQLDVGQCLYHDAQLGGGAARGGPGREVESQPRRGRRPPQQQTERLTLGSLSLCAQPIP